MDQEDEDGRRTYPESAFIEAVEEGDMITTTEVAEAVGCIQQVAHYRLTHLEDEGKVESRKVGAARAWRIT